MYPKQNSLAAMRRLSAVKTADTINAIGGVPVSERARRLSAQWARGEISGMEMKAALLAAHVRPAETPTDPPQMTEQA